MADVATVADRPTPLTALRLRWPLAVVMALIGAGLGAFIASTHPTHTTAEARLAVGSQSLTVYQIQGFAVAAEQLAANYARYVNDSTPDQRLLHDKMPDGVDTLTAVSASPIPDSNVLRIEVTGTDSRAAQQAAQIVARDLAARATGSKPPSARQLLREYGLLSLQVENQKRMVAAVSGRAAVRAKAVLATLSLRQSAVGGTYAQTLSSPGVESELRVIQSAEVVGNDTSRVLQVSILTGIIAGLIVALVIAAMVGRRSGPGGGRGWNRSWLKRRHSAKPHAGGVG